MTEQELRDKIVAALKKGQETFSADFHSMMTAAFEDGAKHFGSKDIKKSIYEYYASALIAAGLKFDVNYSFTAAFNSVQVERERDLERRLSAAEHRAEVAEAEAKKY